MDRGAWQATVCGVTRSWTQLSEPACMKEVKKPQRFVKNGIEKAMDSTPLHSFCDPICCNGGEISLWL